MGGTCRVSGNRFGTVLLPESKKYDLRNGQMLFSSPPPGDSSCHLFQRTISKGTSSKDVVFQALLQPVQQGLEPDLAAAAFRAEVESSEVPSAPKNLGSN